LCQSTRTAKTLKTRGKTDLYTYVQNTSFVNMYIEKRITARFSSRELDVLIPRGFLNCHTVRLHKISFRLTLEIETATENKVLDCRCFIELTFPVSSKNNLT
jgi:hypothetical protein